MLNPLDVLETMATSAETDRDRISAAKALAEYTHAKRPPVGNGADIQEVNIVMLIGDDKSKTPIMVGKEE